MPQLGPSFMLIASEFVDSSELTQCSPIVDWCTAGLGLDEDVCGPPADGRQPGLAGVSDRRVLQLRRRGSENAGSMTRLDATAGTSACSRERSEFDPRS